MEKIYHKIYQNMNPAEFNGSPALYKKVTMLITTILVAWIYLGFMAIKYFLVGENWFSVWQIPVALIAFWLFFKGYYFKSIMRLDAQYGRGGGWTLREVTVKLPEMKVKK